MTKRQKIGRGLRIPVNQDGERSFDTKLNVLTVIANESYKDFAAGLQKEYEESGYEFGKVTITTIAGLTYDKSFDGPTFKITYQEAEKIIHYLKDNEYLNSKGFLTDKIEDKGLDFKMPGELEKFSYVVYHQLQNVGRKIPVRPVQERKKVNLNKEYTFHSLRHGFATRLVENGVPINQIQVLLGHSNISTTSVYLRAAPMDALKSYEDFF
jgi:type III restriction enzyme